MKRLIDYKSRFRLLKGGKVSLVVSAMLGGATISFAAPTGGTVTSGSANISQVGTVTNIDQSTQKASINWQSFSIASNETVNFNQPNSSSITLNRVIGNERSIIDGAMNANGQIWLLNSNGVLFGKNASINTAGLLATTAQLSDTDFQNGNYNFKNATANSVINEGTITISDSGSVILASNEVRNSGTIEAIKGKVHLTGASDYTINLNGNSLVNLKVDKGVLDAMVENSGHIIADGGEIYLTTNAVDELLKGVVNNTGIIEANSLDGLTGEVILFAHGGEAQIGGTIEALDGFVETSGKYFDFLGADIQAGHWLIDPTNITIDAAMATALQTQLASGDASVVTVDTGSEDGNINVESAITWNSSNTLTLDADGAINIGADITTTNGDLVLHVGAAGVLVGFNADGSFKGSVNLTDTSTLTINDMSYTVINTLAELQAIPTGFGLYALGSDIDASGSAFTPIGTASSAFGGYFNGLGHTIDGLNFNDSNYNGVGLFGIARSAYFSNVGIINANITGKSTTGILVGALYTSGSIKNSYTTGSVSGDQNTGGLIAVNEGSIFNSYSKANVTGLRLNTGGLVGASYGTINNSYSTGTVDGGTDNTGGLVGDNMSGTTTDSYSISSVSGGGSNVGGLVGRESSTTIENSYYDKTINSSGMRDTAYGKTTTELQSYDTFSGWEIIVDTSLSHNAYPILVTKNGVTSWAIYADGTPVNYTLSDILTGYTYDGTSKLLSSLWNVSSIFGDTYSSWVLGTDYNFMYDGSSVTGFTNAGTYSNISIDILKDGFIAGSSTNGSFKIDQKEITAISGVTAQDKIYDGLTSATTDSSSATLSGVITGDELNIASLTASFAVKHVGVDKVVGISTVTLGGAAASNYKVADDALSGVTATITPKEVVATGLAAADKYYDGTRDGSLSSGSITTIAGDDIALTYSGENAYSSKNVGTYNDATFTLYFTGADAGNYHIENDGVYTLSSTIHKREIALYESVVDTKEYDGTTAATLSGGQVIWTNGTNGYLGGIVSGDDISYTYDANFASKDASDIAQTISLSNAQLSGSDASNYDVNYFDDFVTLEAIITPKNIGVSASKVYDGTADISSVLILNSDDIIGADSVTLSGGATVSSKNAGTYTGFASNTLALDNTNYKINTDDIEAIITRKEVALTNFSAQDKIYDGTTSATVSADGIDTSDIVAGDTASFDSSLLSGVFENAQAGTDKNVFASDNSILAGVDGGNYKLTGTTTANIAAAPTSSTQQEQEIADIVTPIINGTRTEVNVPQTVVNTTVANSLNLDTPKVQTPAMQQTNANIATNLGIQGANAQIVSTTTTGEQANTVVTLADIQQAMSESNPTASGQPQEVRVPLSKNSIVDLVNGGVNLPLGVEQQFFVVSNEEN